MSARLFTQQGSVPLSRYAVVHLALMGGVFAFSGVVAFIGPSMAQEDPSGLRVLQWVAAGFLVFSIAAAFFVRPVLAGKVAGRRDEALELIDAGQLPQELVLANLVPAAIVEGAGLLGAVTTLVSGELLMLACPAVAVVVLAVLMPTRTNQRSLVESA